MPPAEPTPVQRAEALGHEMEVDPPHDLSAAQRWTCKGCGAAAISYRGAVYGNAIDSSCPRRSPVESR